MNYVEFLFIVSSHKKYVDWASEVPIDIDGNKGRLIYFENLHAYLSKDIGPGKPDIVITKREVDSKWAVREVFMAFDKGVNK